MFEDLLAPLISTTAFAVMLAIAILYIIGFWRLFTKAGVPGWYSLIPILNTWWMFKIAGYKGWLVFVGMIPILGQLAALIVTMLSFYSINLRFGKTSIGWTIFAMLLSPIWVLVLGFGANQFDARRSIAIWESIADHSVA